MKGHTLRYLVQYCRGYEDYNVYFHEDVPYPVVEQLILKIHDKEKTAFFEIHGVSGTPSYWTISYTLRGLKTSYSQIIEKTDAEKKAVADRRKSRGEIISEQLAMAENNLKTFFGIG